MIEQFKCHYGERPATAWPESNWNGYGYYRYFTIFLDKDPGFGSMMFTHIARESITFAEEPPAPYYETTA